MMLDATAGNRMMWRKCNYNPPDVVFLDKEFNLKRPPDILADHRDCPFRDNVFDCIIFDPPHIIKRNPRPWLIDPTEGNNRASFYGFYKTKMDAIISIHKAQKEFQRLTNRICFKWSDADLSLWKVLPFFKEWKILNKVHLKNRLNPIGNKMIKNSYWITFTRAHQGDSAHSQRLNEP